MAYYISFKGEVGNMKVICSYCGKELERKLSQVKKAKKHFCNRDHFYKYRNEFDYHPTNDGGHYRKLKELARIRSERLKRAE